MQSLDKRKETVVISLGGGVQSSTMLLMALHGKFDKLPVCAIFADTGAEPKNVYDYLNWLESVTRDHNFSIIRSSKGNLKSDILDVISGKNKRLANPPFFIKKEDGKKSILKRCCTKEYKIEVVIKVIREQVLGVKYRQRVPNDVYVEQWLGISLDEVFRIKNSRLAWITNRYPLIEKNMTRDDCLEWLREHRYPLPPKSSCLFCPYHSDNMWNEIKISSPSQWEEIVELDKNIRRGLPKVRGEIYLHSSLKPIDQVTFRDSIEKEGTFDNECEGMCGI